MNNHIGAALKAARTSMGLSTADLGALLGLSKNSITRSERGERALQADELLSLTALFGDRFELDTEALRSDVLPDLAARLRTFMARKVFGPEQFVQRDALRERLQDIDESYVETIA